MFADLTSYLLINKASIDDLKSKVATDSVTLATNFRPNFVVDGPNLTPFCEDEWDWIKIGDNVFRNMLPCARCAFVNVDPNSGKVDNAREPLKTLES